MVRPLPNPVTATDEFLAGVCDRLDEQNGLLGEMLARLPERPAAPEPGEPVELREPAAAEPESKPAARKRPTSKRNSTK